MARPLRIEFPGAFYHITCRGNDRRPIFMNDVDRETFLRILGDSLAIYQVVLHAYVLMGNHVHLVPLVQLAGVSAPVGT
jgi:REP element-mobilizing transposase RayT